jgi:hypothetical protein
MDQSVMTFADSAARGSAIGTATEGMVTYLEDTDGLELWNGTAWTGVGGGGATNAIINGAFEIWQRGTSFSTTEDLGQNFFADRFLVQRDGTGSTATVSQQTFTPGTAPVAGYEGQFFARFNQTVAGSGATISNFRQFIEDVRSFAGQTITVSFFAKADSARTLRGISVAQAFGSGGSTQVAQVGSDIEITTSWARYSQTFTLDSVSGKTIGAGSALGITIRLPLNVVQTIDIWGVQVEAGSTATDFRRNANSLQGELAACQRYYFQMNPGLPEGPVGVGFGRSTTVADILVNFPVEMRVAPTSLSFSNMALGRPGVFIQDATNITFFVPSRSVAGLTVTSSGLTSGTPYYLSGRSTGSPQFIGFSAEL